MSQSPDPPVPARMEADLVAWGKVIGLETTGRRSGRPRHVTIGYLEDGGALLVAAASASSHWARNLLARPDCFVQLRGTRRAYRAEVLEGQGRERAIISLILKYGAPAERLAGGIAFRLVPRKAHERGSAVAEP